MLLALAYAAAWPLLAHLDNGLEADMPTLHDRLQARIRAYLGTDLLPRMEHTMSDITDALNRLAQQVNGVSAAQATSFHNLQVAIDELKAGKLSAEQQEIVTRIEGALTKLGEDAAAGDDGFEPVEDVPSEPETPASPVDELPTDALPQVAQPAQDTAPVEGNTEPGTARRN